MSRPTAIEPRTWRLWLDTHRDELATLAIPLELYSSREAWGDFLSNGSAAFGRGRDRGDFDFNSMTIPEQQRLLAFLERVAEPGTPPSGLIGFLRVRASRGWS